MAKIITTVYKTLLNEWRKFIRYVIAGITSAVVNIGLLYVLTEFAGWWYLASSTVAFSVAVVVSFTLQKFWAFKEHSTERIAKQATVFLTVALINLAFNGALMYALVDWLLIPYILAQIITGAVIALWSFFIYHFLVFSTVRFNSESH